MERLSEEDRTILELESRTIVGHTCKVLVLEPNANSEPLVETLRRAVGRRLANAPRLRQRLLRAPFTLAAPAWVDDPQFDIANHIQHLPSGEGASRSRLHELSASLMSEHLDRSRPLWSLHVVEALEDGAAALIWRVHHCMADGSAVMRFGEEVLWDPVPDPPLPPPESRWNPSPIPGSLRMLAAGAAERLRTRAPTSPYLPGIPTKENLVKLAATVRRELMPKGGPSPFDVRRMGIDRQVAFTSAPLADLKGVGKSCCESGTVNDVILALVGAGLRHWIAIHGGDPVTLRAKVPVSLHHSDALANRDSFFFVDLPLGEADPVKRLRSIRDETTVRKSEHDAEELDHVLHDRGCLPRPLEHFLAQRAEDPRVCALCISNVPGPRTPIFVAGTRVAELCSIAEVGKRHALRVSAVSLDGVVSLGLCADAHVVGDPGHIVEGIDQELATLRAHAGAS